MSANEQFDDHLQQKLEEKKTAGTIRTLVFANDKIDFSSNDYFGFAQSGLLTMDKNELPSGATGSRSITGNSALAEETEKLIAQFHGREAALIFNTGYMANVGLFSCITGKGDTYISDEYIHASIIDGMRLSYASRLRFKHNDVNDLEKKLKVATGNKIVAVESIYSMDGDEAPLQSIAALCKQYNALLIVDEAHATGVYGDKGDGLVCKYGLQNEIEEALFAAYFIKGQDIGDFKVLIEIGVAAGLKETDIKKMYETDDFIEEVESDMKMAKVLGVQGVPFYIFNNKYAVSGAQSVTVFKQALEQIWSEEKPPLPDEAAGYCTPEGICKKFCHHGEN